MGNNLDTDLRNYIAPERTSRSKYAHLAQQPYQVLICLYVTASVQVRSVSFYREERWLFDVLGHSEVCRMNNPSTEMGPSPPETPHRSSTSWWQRWAQTCNTTRRVAVDSFDWKINHLSLNIKGVQSVMPLWAGGTYLIFERLTSAEATCCANLFSAARAL